MKLLARRLRNWRGTFCLRYLGWQELVEEVGRQQVR